MNLTSVHSVYLVGIGGIGMSVLARFFKQQGAFVSGYDRTPTELCDAMLLEGIEIHFQDDVALITQKFLQTPKANALVIYTPAIPSNHSELNWLRNEGYSVLKRSEVLGHISLNYKTIAVAGTHGKTTTSAMIAHILIESGLGCHAFLGGISTNYNTNFITREGAEFAVVEADEFDRSFLKLSPQIAIITSVDADHLDVYGEANEVVKSFNDFANRIVPQGTLIKNAAISNMNPNVRQLTYSISQNADLRGSEIEVKSGVYHFDIESAAAQIESVELGLPGRHNVENAVAAAGVAIELDINPDIIKQALASFKGVKRRFETHIRTQNLVYIDDYAHHPTEIAACVASVKEMYPGKKITGVFQPHLYSRTRDFAADFAKALDALDEVILLEIYPARELPITGVDSTMLLNLMNGTEKRLVSKANLVQEMKNLRPEVLITMGAGDIDQLVEPLVKALST
jgi:UDP-N-acetylmuramate--alanine ligase